MRERVMKSCTQKRAYFTIIALLLFLFAPLLLIHQVEAGRELSSSRYNTPPWVWEALRNSTESPRGQLSYRVVQSPSLGLTEYAFAAIVLIVMPAALVIFLRTKEKPEEQFEET